LSELERERRWINFLLDDPREARCVDAASDRWGVGSVILSRRSRALGRPLKLDLGREFDLSRDARLGFIVSGALPRWILLSNESTSSHRAFAESVVIVEHCEEGLESLESSSGLGVGGITREDGLEAKEDDDFLYGTSSVLLHTLLAITDGLCWE
jgi:hypothetical protein